MPWVYLIVVCTELTCHLDFSCWRRCMDTCRKLQWKLLFKFSFPSTETTIINVSDSETNPSIFQALTVTWGSNIEYNRQTSLKLWNRLSCVRIIYYLFMGLQTICNSRRRILNHSGCISREVQHHFSQFTCFCIRCRLLSTWEVKAIFFMSGEEDSSFTKKSIFRL